MKYISNLDIATRDAFLHGYKVNDKGEVVSPSGQIKKSRMANTGYLVVSYRYKSKANPIPVHKLCAYQKYGDIIFSAECIRHLDGNPLNNNPSNIEIGTCSDNTMDISQDVRLNRAIHANQKRKGYINMEVARRIIAFYNKTKSYQKTMEKFNISSKGTLWHVLNRKRF